MASERIQSGPAYLNQWKCRFRRNIVLEALGHLPAYPNSEDWEKKMKPEEFARILQMTCAENAT